MNKGIYLHFFKWTGTIKSKVFNGALLCFLFLLFCIYSQSLAAQSDLNGKDHSIDKKITFDISGGSLEQALLQISEQANMQLVMRANALKKSIPPIQLETTLGEILNQILSKTLFKFQLLPHEQVILISPTEKTNIIGIKEINNNLVSPEINVWEHMLITAQSSQRRNILSSSTSVSYVGGKSLGKLSQESTAEILQQVPGFWVEGSGGETNNNVAPRGLRGGEGFRFISLMEDGLPVVYDGIWPDFFLRQDFMTHGVETTRGGNSGVFTVNGPAAMVNFITKKGGDSPITKIKLSKGADYAFTRIDALTSGPIVKHWYYAIGGFYRQSDGVREPGYTADNGGQIKLNLTKRFTNAELNLSIKHLQDTTTFFTPIPMKNANNPKAIKAIDSNYGTLLSRDFNQLTFKTPEGSIIRDIDDGQQTQLTRLGIDLHWEVAEYVSLSNKFSISDMSNTMYAMMNLGNNTLLSAQSRLAEQDVEDFITQLNQQNPNNEIRAGYSYSHSETVISSPDKLNGNGLVTYAYPLYSHYQQNQWLNHLSGYVDLDNVQLTLGHIFSLNNFDSLPLDKWQGEILTEVKHQPNRLDIVALDQQNNIIDTYSEAGFTSYAGPGYLDGNGQTLSNSIYGNIEWHAFERFIVDLGVRVEHLSLKSIASTDSLYDLDDSKFQSVFTSGYSFYKKESIIETAWSIGVNYQISKKSALFFHLASGFEMPKLINFGNEIGWGNYIDSIPDELGFGEAVTLDFVEGGIRVADNNWHMTATLFETRFNPLPFTVYRGAYDSQESLFIDTKTRGIEFEFDVTLLGNFKFSGLGVWQKAIFNGISTQAPESIYNGNQITRTPEVQLRLTPSYHFEYADLFMTMSYVGNRYSDIANNFKLPAYTVVDVGITVNVIAGIELSLLGKNITNTTGITEGNPRDNLMKENSSDSHVFYARSIFGRSIVLGVQIDF
jgi:outer membrane receptor protein involved in Fe transport